MTAAPQSEVRPYLLRLVGLIVLAIILMSSVATWAWNKYGTRLQDRPPLPSGAPPFGTDAPQFPESPRPSSP